MREMTRVLTTGQAYDCEKLTREAALARRIQGYDKGAFGHSISLPSEEEVDPRFKVHHNNLPFSGALAGCPYLRSIFESFRAKKSSFRLLRRAPRSAYSFHDDRDKGPDILRLQIPIVTSQHAYLVLPREDADLDALVRAMASADEDESADIWFDLEKLERLFGGRLDLFQLEPGLLYFFDTNRIHTLINGDEEERIALVLDVVRNEWVERWISEQLTRDVAPASPRPSPAVRWQWNALRHGVIRNP